MMTSSNGNIFGVTGHLCGEFTGPGEFPAQRPVTRSFDVFFDLHLNNRLSKQSRGWWFETLSCPLWRQCNAKYFGRMTAYSKPFEQLLINTNQVLNMNIYPNCATWRLPDTNISPRGMWLLCTRIWYASYLLIFKCSFQEIDQGQTTDFVVSYHID